MRTTITRTLLAATAALLLGVAAAGTAFASPPTPPSSDEPEGVSLSWLADAIESGDAEIQIFATDLDGSSIELNGEFRDQILSFVTGALRSGAVNGSVTTSVTVLDEAGNVLYSDDEIPGNLDELIGLLAN